MGTMRSMFGSRGKPPRGYQRSDDRLREMICERLMEEGSVDASDVEIDVKGGRVTLEGSVDNRMAKYQIEDMIEQFGVSDVQNNLRVSRRDESGDGRSSSERSSQSGSSGGGSSLGMSGSGATADRTAGSGGSGGSSTLGGNTGGSKGSTKSTQ